MRGTAHNSLWPGARQPPWCDAPTAGMHLCVVGCGRMHVAPPKPDTRRSPSLLAARGCGPACGVSCRKNDGGRGGSLRLGEEGVEAEVGVGRRNHYTGSSARSGCPVALLCPKWCDHVLGTWLTRMRILLRAQQHGCVRVVGKGAARRLGALVVAGDSSSRRHPPTQTLGW